MLKIFKGLKRFIQTTFLKPIKSESVSEDVIMPISNNPGKFVFYCPGCQANHIIDTSLLKGKSHHVLTGTYDKPTIRASVLSNSMGELDKPRCHSFVTDGKIKFLEDCTHSLAGKTVPLMPL
ncbi:MAG: hypothetical protein EOP45_01050 [Sphingobacteriaceae bacterium]|nr:MAG: hypothetical protein EOP45_01050 [Sphingobacteriaceae bacterium]